jgi:hypothetical protein
MAPKATPAQLARLACLPMIWRRRLLAEISPVRCKIGWLRFGALMAHQGSAVSPALPVLMVLKGSAVSPALPVLMVLKGSAALRGQLALQALRV